MKKILIILIFALLLGGTGYMIFNLFDNNQFKNVPLKSVSWSEGGGMLGGYSSIRLSLEKDGKGLLTFTERKTHADREVMTVYEVDPAALEELAKMADQYHLYAASKRPYSKIQVMDGETSSLSFSYLNGSFRISGSQELKKSQIEGFNAVYDYLVHIEKGEGVTTIEKQKLQMYTMTGYNFIFLVEPEFDGKLDPVLSGEHTVNRLEDYGWILANINETALSGAAETTSAYSGTLVYDPSENLIIFMDQDHKFDHPVTLLAVLQYNYKLDLTGILEPGATVTIWTN